MLCLDIISNLIIATLKGEGKGQRGRGKGVWEKGMRKGRGGRDGGDIGSVSYNTK